VGIAGVLIQIGGLLIVLAILIDIYLTVLHGGKISLISGPYIRLIWWIFCRVSELVPRRRNRILSYAGPTLIPAIINMWAVMLSIGFALIFLPTMGIHIVAASGDTTPTGFWPALYFSMMSLVTLGAGDLVSNNNLYRIFDVLGAFAGFSVLTAAISYLMSIYSALTRHRSFALALQHATGDKGTSIDLITKLGAGGDFTISQSTMGTFATELISLIEAHHTYTVLRYFRPHGNAYALPRIAFIVLDTASLIRTALDQERYYSLVQSTSIAQLWGGGMQMVKELGEVLSDDDIDENRPHDEEREQFWREHFATAIDRFRVEGIGVTDSPDEAADHYIELRRQWHPYLAAFSKHLMYDERAIHPGESD